MRTRWLIVSLVLIVLAFGAGVFVPRAWLPASQMQETPALVSKKTRYQCAMHPQIVSDHPDVCPICQMKLQRVEDGEAPADASAAPGAPDPASKILFYRHPMRADVTSPEPAQDEMGMAYIPVRAADLAAGSADDVPGHAPFTLSTERQQLIGVTRTKLELRPLDTEIRAVGKVAYDPMLYQAITEYREALKARASITNSSIPEAHDGAHAIVRSASVKLQQMGISEQQIREIAETGTTPLNLLLPGKSVWIYAQVYEYEVDLVHQGQVIEVTTPALPGRTFTAKVVAVDAILNATTRTVRVRALVQTPDATLRPETFVHVKIRIPLGEKLAVPEDAVLDTGEHQIVFVVKGQGHFEPRAVQLGREAEGYYEVLSGVEAGEEVVTSANFLIDSESRFRAALAAFVAKPASEQAR
ncbi:MAG: efflux RND transporter periplasmic adaptor subunit [Deltaproteobacteria bacterium]|nr:efflux RND transporter periplasmic adaptor subunit [Deltaproteobacteria bacterium]